MKTVIFCFVAFTICIAPTFSQNQVQTNATAAPEGWQETTDWLDAFHAVFGKEASTNWISQLAKEGRLYLNAQKGGLIIVLPGYMHSEARLQAKLDYGFYKVKNTLLFPLENTITWQGDHLYARFLGTLEGVPATLDMAVFRQDGKYRTVMGFHPGNELTSEFSTKFRQDASRLLNSPALASR